MAKTAMQELVLWIEDFHPNKLDWVEIKQKLLDKEREQIERAFDEGVCDWTNEGDTQFVEGYNYYTKTYGNADID